MLRNVSMFQRFVFVFASGFVLGVLLTIIAVLIINGADSRPEKPDGSAQPAASASPRPENPDRPENPNGEENTYRPASGTSLLPGPSQTPGRLPPENTATWIP